MGNKPVYKMMKSDKKDKKFKVITPENKIIYFGAAGYNDFTIWNKLRDAKAKDKKKAYIARHQKTEDWTKSGINTAAFWAKHILWNKETFQASIEDTEKRFNIIITG